MVSEALAPLCFEKEAGHTWDLPTGGAVLAASGSVAASRAALSPCHLSSVSQAGTSSGGGAREGSRTMQGAARESEREFLGQVALFSRQYLLGGHSGVLALDSTLPHLVSLERVLTPGGLGRLGANVGIEGEQWDGPQFWGTAPLHVPAGA